MKHLAHTHLLLDSRIVDKTENLHLELGEVEKSSSNPLFTEGFHSDPPRKWEARFDNLYPSVVYDESIEEYRLWYNSFIRDQASEETPLERRDATKYRSACRQDGLLYAYSNDGIEWQKPDLGIIPFAGSSNNNIVMDSASHGVHGVGVFEDRDDRDGNRRFKALLLNATAKRMATSLSPDGLHWSAPTLWERDEIGDAHPNVIRLPDDGGYVGFMRGSAGETPPNRIVMRTTSTDFVHWSQPERALVGQDLHDQIYSMPVLHHGDIFLGFPAIFHAGEPQAADWDTVDTELAWSPDSVTWHRVRRGSPLIPRGPGRYPTGAYDCGCIYSGVPLLVGDTHRIYYGGSNGPHSGFREGSFCLATLPRDRFAGYVVTDGRRPGRITTSNVVIDGDSLTVNVELGGGSLRAGIMDGSGAHLPGYELDSCVALREGGLDVPLQWRCGLEKLAGQSVHLVFELQNGALYSFAVVRAL